MISCCLQFRGQGRSYLRRAWNCAGTEPELHSACGVIALCRERPPRSPIQPAHKTEAGCTATRAHVWVDLEVYRTGGVWSLGPSCKGEAVCPEVQLSPENPLHVDTPKLQPQPCIPWRDTERGQVACGQDPSTRTRGRAEAPGMGMAHHPSRDGVQPTHFMWLFSSGKNPDISLFLLAL